MEVLDGRAERGPGASQGIKRIVNITAISRTSIAMRFISLSLLVFLAFSAPLSADWPQFRGPDGQGHSDAKGLPLHWNEAKNVTWKTAIPGKGWSSPVISGNQVWMTSATAKGLSLHAVCVDRWRIPGIVA